MKRNLTIRSLLAAIFGVAVLLSLQFCAERRMREFEREVAILGESTQARIMTDTDTLTPETYSYSLSDVNLARHTTALDYLFFRRRITLNFRSTNYVGNRVSHFWQHNLEYTFFPFGRGLGTNESSCEVSMKL